MIKRIINDYLENGNGEDLAEFIDKFFCEHKELYNEFRASAEDALAVITPEIAVEAVSKLVRKDGTVGEKWSRADTNEVARQYGLAEKYSDFDPCVFYFAMNYAFAVHHYPAFTIQNFIDIAFDEIHNKNVSLRRRIKEMAEH